MTLLSGPGVTSDTVTAVASGMSGWANSIDANMAAFIADLSLQRGVNYTDAIGDPSVLNYLQWDYDAELARLQQLRPGFLGNLGATSQSLADAITALQVPAAPTLTTPLPQFPTLAAERPQVAVLPLPTFDVGDAPTDAPVLTDLSTPDAPLVTLPTVPTFEELQLPSAPSFSIPTFTDTAPVNQLAPPTATFSFVDAAYTSQLRDPLIAKLLYDLENGGYGIDAADELALWGRARDRAEAQGRLSVDAALKRANSMSFPLPTGALLSALELARADVVKQMSEASRDIALKRADLYVENRRFTIEQVQALEKISIDLHNAIAERSLNAAKATVELGIATFDATVRSFSASLESYKVGAQVFESRIRAELSKAEIYKAQIEAEKLRGEFNLQRVQLYQSQLNGIQTVVNLYKTRVEAVDVLAQIQAQKIEIFKARVQAYAARVGAKAAEFSAYKDSVGAQESLVEMYKTDVSAFETVVRAEEARIRALTQSNEALIQQYKARVEQYTAQLEGVSKRAEIQVDIDKTAVAGQAVNAQVYRALTDAVVSGVQTKIEAQKMNNQWNVGILESHNNVVRTRLEELKTTIMSRVEIDKFSAGIYAQALSAVLSGISGLSVKSA